MLGIIDVDDGMPGPGEIAVDVRAAGVNPADAKSYGEVFGRGAPCPCGWEWRRRASSSAVGQGAVGPEARSQSATK